MLLEVDILFRDVGVAGSNPVTPTIDFQSIFFTDHLFRCRGNLQLGVNLGVSFGAKKPLDIAAVSGRSRTNRVSEYA